MHLIFFLFFFFTTYFLDHDLSFKIECDGFIENWAALWQNQQSDCVPNDDSESLLDAWRKLGSLATHWVHSEDSDQTGPVLVWFDVCFMASMLDRSFALNLLCMKFKFED